MSIFSVEELTGMKCSACEGGVQPMPESQAKEQMGALPAWTLSEDSKMISRKLKCGNFVDGMKLMGRVAEIAEAEQHHPDLHLTGYRHVRIDLTTHAIDGLSENDFIVAAKIEKIVDSQ